MEYSITNFKKIKELETLRFDAEYFRPRYLSIMSLVNQKTDQFSTLFKLNIKCDASAFYPSLEPFYNQGKLPFIRVSDVNNGIDYLEAIKIPESILPGFKTLKIGKKGDLVITKGGSIGRIGLVEERTALSRDLIYINSSILEEYEYQYLFIYFSTTIYNDLLVRSSSMTAQPHLTLTLVKDIPIYNPSNDFKKKIAKLYTESKQLLENSKQLYLRAEERLLKKMNLLGWEPKVNLSFTNTVSTVLKNGRLDAEYYQPQYTQIVDQIRANKDGFVFLNKAAKIKDKNFTPLIDSEYKYVELSSISKTGFIKDLIVEKGQNLPSRARRKIIQGDLIVSSVEGSLESIALISKNLDKAVASTGFFILESQEINSETLFIMLKSKIGQLQLKRGCKGTILTAIAKDEFEKIILPRIDFPTQNELKDFIQEMYTIKNRSDHLLKIAIEAVEFSINKSEKFAMEWLETQLL